MKEGEAQPDNQVGEIDADGDENQNANHYQSDNLAGQIERRE
jgi:hypothetical protein